MNSIRRFISITPLLFITILSVTYANAAQPELTVSGRVIGENQEPIGYATVVALRDEQEVSGVASDSDGSFSLVLPAGDYTLKVSYVGYEIYSCEVSESCELGDVVLKARSEEIEGVTVTTSVIRREADRFVVDVANAHSAIGKDGEELLRTAPGVWINDDKISINGNSNPKIYINDREMKLSPEQMLLYLRTLKSEDVQRIEVIPTSGADYDADSSSGIIKITLRRQLHAGMMGSATMRSHLADSLQSYMPSLSLNFQSSKLTLNTSAWYNNSRNVGDVLQSTIYSGSQAGKLESSLSSESGSTSGGGRVEAIYDINPRHSVGTELSLYSSLTDDSPTIANSTLLLGAAQVVTDGRFTSPGSNDNASVALNYIYKIDSLGSTLKFLADHNYNFSHTFGDNRTTLSGVDSLYNMNARGLFSVTSATLALEKIISPTMMIKSGVKYTNNMMDSRTIFNSQIDGDWCEMTKYNKEAAYSENIAAAYLIGSARVARWSVVAGLRAEYTDIEAVGESVNRSYLSWFPNANISYSFDDAGRNSLVAQYARTIARPNFWYMNPARVQASEYMYQMGDPNLKSAYTNSLNLTFVYGYRYTLTVGGQLQQDNVQQAYFVDEENELLTYIKPVNSYASNNCYITTYLPFSIAKWWDVNLYLLYMYGEEQVTSSSPKVYNSFMNGSLSSTITFPHDFYAELTYNMMGRYRMTNVEVNPSHTVGISLKKRMFNNALTASASVYNLLNSKQRVVATTPSSVLNNYTTGGWSSRFFSLSLTYNFKAGKEYQQRTGVEYASSEDKTRMQNSK